MQRSSWMACCWTRLRYDERGGAMGTPANGEPPRPASVSRRGSRSPRSRPSLARGKRAPARLPLGRRCGHRSQTSASRVKQPRARAKPPPGSEDRRHSVALRKHPGGSTRHRARPACGDQRVPARTHSGRIWRRAAAHQAQIGTMRTLPKHTCVPNGAGACIPLITSVPCSGRDDEKRRRGSRAQLSWHERSVAREGVAGKARCRAAV